MVALGCFMGGVILGSILTSILWGVVLKMWSWLDKMEAGR